MFQRVGGCSSSQSLGLTEVLLTNSWAARMGRGLTLSTIEKHEILTLFLIPIILYNYIDCGAIRRSTVATWITSVPAGVGYQKLAEPDQIEKPGALSRTIMTGPEEILSCDTDRANSRSPNTLSHIFRSLILFVSLLSRSHSHTLTHRRGALRRGVPAHLNHSRLLCDRNDFAKQLKEQLVSRAIIRSGDDRLVREIEFLVPGLTA